MRRFAFLFLASVVLLTGFPAPVSALNTGDTTVIVPIIGRFPGVGGSQWRTDLFIANRSTISKTLTLTFHVAGAAPLQRSIPIEPFTTLSLADLVLNTFGLSNASGQLEITSSNMSGFESRARIYNAGSAAGEFGQNVPGLGLRILSRQAYMFGLSGINGNRVNIGVANPNATAVSVNLQINGRTNNSLHSEAFTLQPHQTLQFNDIFTRFGIAPQADVQVQFFTETALVYGYASEVRNDTGDAIFIFGTSPNS